MKLVLALKMMDALAAMKQLSIARVVVQESIKTMVAARGVNK